MRRPMVPAAAGLSLGILAGYYTTLPLWAGLFALALFFLAVMGKKSKALLILLLFLSLGSLLFWNSERMEVDKGLPGKIPIGEEVTLKGEVLSLKTKRADEKSGRGESHRMEVKTEGGRILVRWYGELPGHSAAGADLVGREVEVRGVAEEPTGRRNPKCFDYRLYLKTRKIHVVMTANHIEPGKVVNRLYYGASKVTENFERQLTPRMKEGNREMVIAMLFGDKSGLDEEDYEKFQRNGTAHLLATSGLHVGVVYGFLVFLFRSRRSLPLQFLIIGSLIFYAAMAGFAPSIVRAVMMIILHILAELFHYRYDLMSAASFTALVMLAANPYALFGLGFQMSFLAIFSLSMFTGPTREEGGAIRKILAPIFVIQCAMAPFTAYTFNYFSVTAFLANVPMIFLAGILMPVGVVTMVSGVAEGFHLDFLATMLDVSAEAMIFCNDLFYGEGGGAVDVVSPPIIFLAFYYLLGFYVLSEMCRIQKSRRQYGEIGAWIGVLISAALIFSIVTKDGFEGMPIVFVDVGQGNCLCITTPQDRTILIDGGGSANYDVGKKTVKPYLLKNGISAIDLAIVSHTDEDHYGGIRSLQREGMVGKVVLEREKGDVIYREEDFSIEVLGPLDRKTTGNEGSLVLKVRYGELTILAPGDISQEEEAALVREYSGGDVLSADVLAVPHHGSRYSSSPEFIEAVNPRIAVIQVGKNNYGHPAPSVIEKYEERRIMLYRNDEHGAVAIAGGKNGSIKLQTQQ